MMKMYDNKYRLNQSLDKNCIQRLYVLVITLCICKQTIFKTDFKGLSQCAVQMNNAPQRCRTLT